MRKYEALAAFIIENVGGKDNVESLTHCMTRLRFILKNEELVKADVLKDNKEIYTVNFAGGQVQVVVGNKVEDVFEEVMGQIGMKKESSEELQEKNESGQSYY